MMFVANRMTKNPVTVTPDTGVDEAARLMKKNGFRRLPVVEDGTLVGFLNDKDIMRVAPSPATTLSRYEELSLLSKLKIREVMQSPVITVGEDAALEQAALIMYENKIGGLPVVSSVGAVVGVITETDIFKAFVDIMDLHAGKTRFTIHTDNKVGVVHDISGIFAEKGYNIDTVVTCAQKDGSYEIVILGDFKEVDALKQDIEAHGYEVMHITTIQ